MSTVPNKIPAFAAMREEILRRSEEIDKQRAQLLEENKSKFFLKIRDLMEARENQLTYLYPDPKFDNRDKRWEKIIKWDHLCRKRMRIADALEACRSSLP